MGTINEPRTRIAQLSERQRLSGLGVADDGRTQLDAVLEGEPLEIVTRELAVTAADLSGWREAFLETGAASLSSRGTIGTRRSTDCRPWWASW